MNEFFVWAFETHWLFTTLFAPALTMIYAAWKGEYAWALCSLLWASTTVTACGGKS